ncbi:host attachment protein [Acidocella sp. MX-AZ03]|uniref:host attachment protein n=1 Tax=Acidocella sp. MX-AZ03 TaxID=2697363 RepID=UPI0022DD9E4A|nr:host attachment protein [Acidocella sp. MX-AZ03]WBO59431.1 host attachment protein [Acidocella sp. MX-AZ03]
MTKTNVLHTVRTLTSAEAHRRSAELRSDRPGASFHSDSTAHHAITPRHDPHELEKERFARLIADEINGMQAKDFDSLVIVAPSHILSVMKRTLHPLVLAKLLGEVDKDLVKTPNDKLWKHLEELMPTLNPRPQI